MKTKKNASMTGGLLTFLMTALILLTIVGCDKDPIIPDKSLTESEYPENWISQTFTLDTEGTEVNAFGGSVLLKFQKGSVAAPTVFSISYFPVNHIDLDGMNMYNMGLYLKGDSPNQKLNNVSIQVYYDLVPESWKQSVPGPTDASLTIYHVSPDINDYQIINSIGECKVDCSSTMIRGCISCCGFYVVGEK